MSSFPNAAPISLHVTTQHPYWLQSQVNKSSSPDRTATNALHLTIARLCICSSEDVLIAVYREFNKISLSSTTPPGP